MANADGSVIIKADIDDKQAQKELNALEKKIEGRRKSSPTRNPREILCLTKPTTWAHSLTKQRPNWRR